MLRASTAIIAVLALGSTPVWAQDAAAPPIDPPAASAPAPAPAALPAIQLPTQAPVPAAPAASGPVMTSQPMVQQTPPNPPAPVETLAEQPAPKARAAASRPAAKVSASAATPAARSAIAPSAAVPAASTPSTSNQPATTEPPAASVPLSPPADTPPPVVAVPEASAPQAEAGVPVESTPADGDTMAVAGGVAALLLALGLGGGAYAAMRARRRRRWDAYQGEYATRPSQVFEPAPAPAVAVSRPVVAPAAPLSAYAMAEDVAGEAAAKPAVAQRMGSEELVTQASPRPAKVDRGDPVPQTRAERDALLDRMIAEPPSAENPFTSRKARRRRARIILQSREIDWKNAAEKPFDWRAYKPSTSNPAPATPPRVTA